LPLFVSAQPRPCYTNAPEQGEKDFSSYGFS
jgi:hypothetical protein